MNSAFLCQITVAESFRGMGYGPDGETSSRWGDEAADLS